MDWLCLAGIATAILGGATVWWLLRPKPAQCPNCQGSAIGVTGRDATGMRHADISGGGGGGYANTQVDYTITYRCNACRHTWTHVQTETR